MAEPIVTVEKLKLSLRVDSDVDDQLLKGYSLAAENYIKNAIGYDHDDFYESERVSSLFETAVIAQASAYYSFRTALSFVNSYPVEPAVDSIVSQLQAEYAKFEEDLDADKSK